jgi:hypothetical protein
MSFISEYLIYFVVGLIVLTVVSINEKRTGLYIARDKEEHDGRMVVAVITVMLFIFSLMLMHVIEHFVKK